MTPKRAFERTVTGQVPPEMGDLVRALQRNDSDAWGRAYLQYRDVVHSFLCRIVGCRTMADDLTQETFLLLPRAMRSFRGSCSLKTFIISIAVNLGRHYVRTSLRRRRFLDDYAEQPELRSVESPEQLLERRQTGAGLVRALSLLSAEKQETFVLREYHEYSSLETAQMIGAPEATVRTRVHHARRILRDALEQQGYETAA